jgi:DNA-binding beta-propeller fold protein YncE
MRAFPFLVVLALLAPLPDVAAQAPVSATRTVELRAILQRAPRMPLKSTEIAPTPPAPGWEMGMVSWVAAGRDGLVYLLQRGDNADPIVVIDRDGRVVRSWGKGRFVMPHAIRVDARGNIWTTDAASSMVHKFSADGDMLMAISAGGQPSPCRNNFCGTTDVAFARDGHVLVSDGYANARILEYTPEGRKVREWGRAGTGPGQFQLPHSIAIDDRDIIYVADRENGRVQRFDRTGRFLGEWTQYGKTFSLVVQGPGVWLATQPIDEPNLSPGWLVHVDRATGSVLGYVDAAGVHGMDVLDAGEPIFGPGPSRTTPVWFRSTR